MKYNQLQHMLKNPKAMVDYQTQRKEPQVRMPSATPLWQCLNQLPPRLRVEIKAIRLCPALGYNSQQVFQNAEQLFNFLGGQQEVVGNHTLASESRIIRGFQKPIAVEELLGCARQYPAHSVFERHYRIKLNLNKLPTPDAPEGDGPAPQ